jgi:hypothetical protein
MYRRIVLAVDPEGLAESVLPIVAALARRGGGEVFVVGAAKAGDPPAASTISCTGFSDGNVRSLHSDRRLHSVISQPTHRAGP